MSSAFQDAPPKSLRSVCSRGGRHGRVNAATRPVEGSGQSREGYKAREPSPHLAQASLPGGPACF